MRRQRPTKAAKRYLSPAERKGKNLKPPVPYRSWLEADVTHQLEAEGVQFEYESETLFYAEPAKVRKYTPDLRIVFNNIIVEVKGRWTAHDRKKMSLVIEQNPDRDIRMLFAADNKISRSSSTRYSDWCIRRGITYAIGKEVPVEWTEEQV